jgi:hypothetical protein
MRNVDGNLVCVPLKSQDAKPQFTDGHTTDQLALHRPGFRIPIVNDRRAVLAQQIDIFIKKHAGWKMGKKFSD